MRYLVSYDSLKPDENRGEGLRVELVNLLASPFHRWAWVVESRLTARELLAQLRPHLEDGDRIVVIDVTDREAVAEQVTPETRVDHPERTPAPPGAGQARGRAGA